ncbi:E7 protein [Molossus molossus papillomavirus type 2]|nr:E7 protein [Molossus molossus papillomavirus type 2]
MIGKEAQLKDIVLLEDPPEPVSLICHEALEDEEELQGDHYKISAACPYCPRKLRIVVQSTAGGILTLQRLLSTSEVTFVCAVCAKERHYG